MSSHDDAHGAEEASERFPSQLARAIRTLRAERGLDRRTLAARAGISYPFLSEIESGRKRPSAQTLLGLARALAVRPHELLALAEALGRRAELEGTTAESVAPRRSRFFHAPSASPPRAASPSAALERASPPRSLAVVLEELRGLLEQMAPDDVDRILDLARRLSQER